MLFVFEQINILFCYLCLLTVDFFFLYICIYWHFHQTMEFTLNFDINAHFKQIYLFRCNISKSFIQNKSNIERLVIYTPIYLVFGRLIG